MSCFCSIVNKCLQHYEIIQKTFQFGKWKSLSKMNNKYVCPKLFEATLRVSAGCKIKPKSLI